MRYTIGLITWVLLMSYGIFKPGNPNDPASLLFPGDDKLIHWGLFGGATLLFILAMVCDWGIRFSQAARAGLISGLFFACITEPIQYYVPFRTPDWYDFLSNILGVLTGLVISNWLIKRRKMSWNR